MLATGIVLGAAGCTGGAEPPTPTGGGASASSAPQQSGTTADPAPTTAAPAPDASAAPAPGDPCDPAAGDPDCTDATGDATFRYVEGYADCVAEWSSAGQDEAYGLCTDLDGDGTAGYPDTH